jgi:hypothetical protein
MWDKPVLIGIQGSSTTSPFQSIPIKPIMEAIQMKWMTQMTNKVWLVPSLEQFLASSSEEDFEGLKAEKGAKTPEGEEV